MSSRVEKSQSIAAPQNGYNNNYVLPLPIFITVHLTKLGCEKKNQRNREIAAKDVNVPFTLMRRVFFKHWMGSRASLLATKDSSGSLNGRWGIKDDRATAFLHSSLSSAFRRASPNPHPIHSDLLSSHLFFCLPFLLTPCTVPCRTIFASPVDLVMCLLHGDFYTTFNPL